MAEVSTIDVFGCIIKLGYGSGHRTCQAISNQQRDHFNQSEDQGHNQQADLDRRGQVSQSAKEVVVQLGNPGLHAKSGWAGGVTRIPIYDRNGSGKADLTVQAARRRWHSPGCIGGREWLLSSVQHVLATVAFPHIGCCMFTSVRLAASRV